MARPGVTYLDVSNAAQQLVASGRPPTIESIRILLGTGSNSTLGTHLRTWKAKQEQSQQIAIKENIPEELIAAVKGVWERIINHSEDKIQIIEQQMREELQAVQKEWQDLQQENTRLQQHHQQVKQERDNLILEKGTLEQLLTQTKLDVAALNEKSAGFEQQARDKQDRINELRQQNQQIQANLEHYRNASLEQRLADQERYEQQLKQLELTQQKISQKLTAVNQENELFKQQYQQSTNECKGLTLQLAKLESQQETLNTRLSESISELAKKTQEHHYSQEQFQNIQQKYHDQNDQFVTLQTKHAVLQQQVEMLKNELHSMSEQNKVLAHDKWILGQEKAELYGQLKQLNIFTQETIEGK